MRLIESLVKCWGILFLALVFMPVLNPLYFHLYSPCIQYSSCELTLLPLDKAFYLPLPLEHIETAPKYLLPILLIELFYSFYSLLAYLRLALIDKQ